MRHPRQHRSARWPSGRAQAETVAFDIARLIGPAGFSVIPVRYFGNLFGGREWLEDGGQDHDGDCTREGAASGCRRPV